MRIDHLPLVTVPRFALGVWCLVNKVYKHLEFWNLTTKKAVTFIYFDEERVPNASFGKRLILFTFLHFLHLINNSCIYSLLSRANS